MLVLGIVSVLFAPLVGCTKDRGSEAVPKGPPMTTVVFFDLGDTLVVRRNEKDERRVWAPGAKQALASLSKTALRLGILSNTGGYDREQLRKILPIDFDYGTFEEGLVVLSGEVGEKKPEPKIYAIAIERAGVPAEQILYVGEDSEETRAAETAGMGSHQINALPDDLEKLTRRLGASTTSN